MTRTGHAGFASGAPIPTGGIAIQLRNEDLILDQAATVDGSITRFTSAIYEAENAFGVDYRCAQGNRPDRASSIRPIPLRLTSRDVLRLAYGREQRGPCRHSS